jgi:hypothetical protein
VPTPTDRLRPAPDEHSDIHPLGQAPQTSQKAPLATSVAVQMLVASGRGARRHHNVATNEGASSMAKRTRSPGVSDSGTRATGVNITPPTQPGPVTTTHAVA